MFVARIRADQVADQNKNTEQLFKPLMQDQMTKAPAAGEKKRDFDSSWI